MPLTRVPVLPAGALRDGEVCGVTVDGMRVLVVRLGEQTLAWRDRCAHLGLPLSGGTLDGTRLSCPHHGWCYDLRTGAGVNPRRARLEPVPLVEDDDGMLVLEVGDVR